MRIAVGVIALLIFSGCSGEKPRVAELRICAVSSAAVCILNQLQCAPAAVDEYSLPFAAKGTPLVGKGAVLSAERMLELGINCVIIWEYQRSAAAHLARRGIKIFEIKSLRLKELPELMLRLGKLTGKERESAVLAAEFRKKLWKPDPQAASRRVYLELYSRNRGAGKNSYSGDLLAAAGAESIFEKTSLVSSEEIIRRDPEIIFYVENCGSAEEIMKRPGMNKVSAVKNKKVFPVPRRFLVEGAAPVEGIEYFKKRISG
ncbi:MAG: ABC transporter substrate-binding protein [Lentisphaeria bacterium]|nr:ABC transporter substrate-binding protein [Lentisphaeria bacterium]